MSKGGEMNNNNAKIHQKNYQESFFEPKAVKKPGAKRQLLLIMICLVFFLLLGIASFFIFMPKEKKFILENYEYATVALGNIENTIEVVGNVFINDQENARPPMDGVIESIEIEEGDWIPKNTVCFKLKSDEIESKIKSLELEYDIMELEYEKNKEVYAAEDLNRQLHVAILEKNYSNKVRIYNTQKDMYEKNFISLDQLFDAEHNMDSASLTLKNQKARNQEIAINFEYNQRIKKNQMLRTQHELKLMRQEANSCTIRNSINGEIIEINKELNDHVYKNDVLFVIHDNSSAIVIVEIPESKIDLISVGYEAEIIIGDNIYTGVIDRIANQAISKSNSYESVIEVEIISDEWEEELMSGISAEVKISTGVEEGVLYLPRKPYLISGNQRYVYVIKGGVAVKKEVEYGSISSETVIVEKGLEAGDKIIVTNYGEYIDFDQVDLKPQTDQDLIMDKE